MVGGWESVYGVRETYESGGGVCWCRQSVWWCEEWSTDTGVCGYVWKGGVLILAMVWVVIE